MKKIKKYLVEQMPKRQLIMQDIIDFKEYKKQDTTETEQSIFLLSRYFRIPIQYILNMNYQEVNKMIEEFSIYMLKQKTRNINQQEMGTFVTRTQIQ